MKNAIYTSIVMHALIFILITITLPEIKTKEIDFIPIEIIIDEEATEIQNIDNKHLVEKEIDNKEINTIPNIPRPQQKPSEIIKEKNIIEEKTTFIPNIPSKKPEFNSVKPEVRPIKKEEKVINDDIFDDMLKNLEKPEPDKNNNKDFDNIVKELALNNPSTETPIYKDKKPSNTTLAKLEQNIANQIRKHYTIPPGLDSVLVSDVKVPITINIRKDGKITRIIINKNALKKAQNDPVYRSFLEAAERAVKKLSKFDKLPLDLYSHWDKISINFTPI